MAMHIMPAYSTPTRTRRRKKGKKSKSLLAAERNHEKFLKKMKIRGGSSVGRASALQAEGQGFDSLPLHQNTASVAQKEEQLICNHQVVSSILTCGTKIGETHGIRTNSYTSNHIRITVICIDRNTQLS